MKSLWSSLGGVGRLAQGVERCTYVADVIALSVVGGKR